MATIPITITPGYQFDEGERLTTPKLNQLGQPIAETGDMTGTIPEDWLDPATKAALEPVKNIFLNGNFNVWPQIDILHAPTFYSLLVNAGEGHIHDYVLVARWVMLNMANRTVSRQEFTPGQTEVPDFPRYYLRWAQTAGVGADPAYFGQRVENVVALASHTVTMTIWIRSAELLVVTPQLRQSFGLGSTSADVLTEGDAVELQAAVWTKVTQVFDVPSVAGKSIGTNAFSEFRIVVPQGTVFTMDFAHAMLVYGALPTRWDHRLVVEEENMARRYYQILGMITSQNIGTWHPYVNLSPSMPFALSSAETVRLISVSAGTGATWEISITYPSILHQITNHSATAFAALEVNGELYDD